MKGKSNRILKALSVLLILCGVIFIAYYIYMTNKSDMEKSISLEIFKRVEDVKVSADEKSVEEDELIPLLQKAFENEDIIAYIYYPNAGISYPVVQGVDNEEYLRKSVYGDYSASGSIMLDCDNSTDFSDTASIVYGHHMRNGSMFGSLEGYILDNGIKGQYFVIYTKEEKITYRISSYETIDPSDRDSYLFTEGENPKEFIDLIKSKTNTCSFVEGDSTFVTLVTCKYVSGKKVRFGVTGSEINREKYSLGG